MTTQTKYRKYDSESDYYAMGYRMYSAEFGRFLAVDPLFEAMPRHNPYHYSYNSPMFWSDPSGLVPVKEKVKNSEKLQQVELDWARINEDNEAWAAIASTIDQIHMSNYQNATATSKKGIFSNFGVNPISGFGISSGGSRIGIVGAGYNGAYQTMELNVPANWDTKSLDKSTEPANEHLSDLQKEYKGIEVGYFLRYDKSSDKLFADFFIGKDGDTWIDKEGFKKGPYDSPLKDSEMIVGFTHTHPGSESSGFSYEDITSIGRLTLGEIKWANRPVPATFNKNDGTVSKILNKHTNDVEKMYFGLIFSKGYESFSWYKGNASLNIFYQNIYYITGRGTSMIWRDYLNKTYNVDYIFRRGKK